MPSGTTHNRAIILVIQKQTAVSHSSSEAELIALDASIRMEGLLAILLWEEILPVFHDDLQPKVYSDAFK